MMTTRWCAFCGKAERECGVLILGPGPASICNGCIAECAGLAAKRARNDLAGPIDLERERRIAHSRDGWRTAPIPAAQWSALTRSVQHSRSAQSGGDDPGDAA